ncbi:ComEC/Rec2 family competence protein [Spiroplasma clarkii]|uniref:ComEC/Rec2 family competence protein n=1 Tax=Spiroplasma clarkii TaxID=2139 RepID=UPI0012FE7482|nr:MBL fold metallo-hydrolase [Spiroplasma clarkii]
MKLTGESTKLVNNGVFWEFNFTDYLKNLNVIGEIKNPHFEICQFKFLRYLFYQVAMHQHELVKILIFQRKAQQELYKSMIHLNISWLLNLSGLLLYPIDYFIEKKLFKFNKTYKKYKIIPILVLLFYCYLLKFPVVMLKVIVVLLIKWYCYVKKFSMSRAIRMTLTWTTLLIFNPLYLFNLGLIYSFLAYFLLTKLSTAHWYKNLFLNFVLIFLLFAPLTLYAQYKLYFFDWLYELILLPFVHLSFLLSLVFFIPKIDVCYDLLVNILSTIVRAFEYGNISIVIGKISVIWFVLYYCGLISYIKLEFKTKRLQMLLLVLLVMLAIPVISTSRMKLMQNSVHMLNVGNGNSFIINYQSNVYMYDVGEGTGHSPTIVKTYFDYLGVTKVNTIFISHHHVDHYNLLESVIASRPVKKVIQNDNTITETAFGDLKVHIFNEYKNSDENDNSMVIIFETPSSKMLFLGDATSKREHRLVQDFRFANLVKRGIDFLQVGHHGSKTSSSEEFIKTIKPKVCFVSGEKKGKKAFPNFETIATLTKHHCQIYTTQGLYSYKFKIDSHQVNLIEPTFW